MKSKVMVIVSLFCFWASTVSALVVDNSAVPKKGPKKSTVYRVEFPVTNHELNIELPVETTLDKIVTSEGKSGTASKETKIN